MATASTGFAEAATLEKMMQQVLHSLADRDENPQRHPVGVTTTWGVTE